MNRQLTRLRRQGGDTLILAIDIGNTNIKFSGIVPCGGEAETDTEEPDFTVLFEDRLPTESGKDLGQFLQDAEQQLARRGITFLPDNSGQTVQAVAVSSVVPAVTPSAVCLAEKICEAPAVVISCRCNSGLSFEGLPAPERVGADRIADAAWAAARYPLPAMTVDLGTATTINVIGPAARPGLKGRFLGGMIGAGVSTSLHALRTGTAQLPELSPRAVLPENLIGIDTDGCMLSSAVVGTAAMIEGLASRVEEQLGRPVTLILTGGNAGFVSPWIRRPYVYEASLASKGTAVIALRENASRELS